jgi:hypothetical protein
VKLCVKAAATALPTENLLPIECAHLLALRLSTAMRVAPPCTRANWYDSDESSKKNGAFLCELFVDSMLNLLYY